MTLDDYQQEAARTAARSLDAYSEPVQAVARCLQEDGARWALEPLLKVFDVLIWGQGLAGEAGEVCDLLKKVHGHGKPYDADKMLKELGDVLWYVANLASAHRFKLTDVAKANVAKLRARYPSGFTVAAATAKADEQVPVLGPEPKTDPVFTPWCGGTFCERLISGVIIHSTKSGDTCDFFGDLQR